MVLFIKKYTIEFTSLLTITSRSDNVLLGYKKNLLYVKFIKKVFFVMKNHNKNIKRI